MLTDHQAHKDSVSNLHASRQEIPNGRPSFPSTSASVENSCQVWFLPPHLKSVDVSCAWICRQRTLELFFSPESISSEYLYGEKNPKPPSPDGYGKPGAEAPLYCCMSCPIAHWHGLQNILPSPTLSQGIIRQTCRKHNVDLYLRYHQQDINQMLAIRDEVCDLLP